MAKLIHTMIRVLDEERSVAFYKKAFGLNVSRRLDKEAFTLIYLRGQEGDHELELTVNKGRDDAYSHGEGYGHIAFVVDDVEAVHARFDSEGMAPRKLVAFHEGEELIAKFFFVEDPDGYQIEVLQRHGHYR